MRHERNNHKQLQPVGQISIARKGFDLQSHLGRAMAAKVKKGQMAMDSMLAVYGDRLTYTFILGREVASIHFDRVRGEIFFKGHNIRNMELTKQQLQALEGLKAVLLSEKQGYPFLMEYSATLDKLLADNI